MVENLYIGNNPKGATELIKKFNANPDSNSGIVTVPKVIEAGESVTIPAGRMAVLPNVQVDGTLNVEGEVFIPAGATLSKLVETEGNQTIEGVKTFSSSPIVPTPTAGDNSTKIATTEFVDSSISTKAPLNSPVFNTSVGIGTNPSGLLNNGAGLALGDDNTGIRQNGDGVLEVITNGQIEASVNTTGFNFSAMPKVNGQAITEATSSYIKFEDGTLICWTRYVGNNTVVGSFAAQPSWVFPIAFVGNRPAITLEVQCGWVYDASWGAEGASTSAVAGIYITHSSHAVSPILALTAIGRWK